MHQYSTAVNNARLDSIETTIGTAPQLRLYSGSMPANPAAAATGTLLATINLPSDWLNAAASGVKSKAGSWTGTFSTGGTVGYGRIYDNAGSVCHMQGAASQAVNLTTSALTAANGNVLNFAATTGVVVGMNVTGTGIPAGTTVVATTGTTVTLSQTSTAGVASGASITFGHDFVLDNVVGTGGQALSVNTFSITAGNP